jgi:MFS family permease
MASSSAQSEHDKSQSKKAAASGWIGSALEYYDFFIYATAAALVFPQIFFPSENPTVAIVASLATYGVGYVARPIGAFFLGHWGDTHGRKTVLILCMFLMGISTMLVGLSRLARWRRCFLSSCASSRASPSPAKYQEPVQ